MCQFWEVGCKIGEAVTEVGNNVIAQWAQAAVESASETLIRLGTFWTALPTPAVTDVGAVTFVQSSTSYIALALVIASIMIAGIQIVWTSRAEPARELLRSLFTFVVVSTVAVTFAQMLITGSDQFSRWLLDSVIAEDSGNFALRILDISNYASIGAVGYIIMILLGLIAVCVNLVQIGLMFVRSAMLILLVGMAPVAFAMTNTQWGKNWASKMLAWFVAFLLHKPLASIIYATAVKLISGDSWSITDGDNIVSFVLGVIMLILAVAALPALITFMTPAASAISSGGGGGGMAAGMAVVATGAAQVQRMSSGAGSAQGASCGAASGGGAAAASGTGAASAGGGAAAGGAAAAAGPVGAAVAVGAQVAKAAKGAAESAAQSAASSGGAETSATDDSTKASPSWAIPTSAPFGGDAAGAGAGSGGVTTAATGSGSAPTGASAATGSIETERT